MIIRKNIAEPGCKRKPDIPLTEEQQKTVTSTCTNGVDGTIIFYQGDEPKFDPVEVKTESPALAAVKAASTEELIEIAQILKPHIQ